MVNWTEFQTATEAFVNPDPYTVRLKPAAPAVAFAGEVHVICGVGVTTGSITKINALEVFPPATVTLIVPAAPISPAAIDAVN